MNASRSSDPDQYLDAIRSAERTVGHEVEALDLLRRSLQQGSLGPAFAKAVGIIGATMGRVIVTGIGKSGLIARKISATLASTGTPSFFLHPAEASHGDLGRIVADDIVMALSWSGETAELSDIVIFCSRFGVPLLALTSRADSTLGRSATLCLSLPEVEEACPHRLAPTSSTIVQLAIGDALAVTLIEQRGFSPDRFKTLHPKGTLGAQLTTLGDLMATNDAVPKVRDDATIVQAMMEMSAKRYGITAVVDEDDKLLGAFSDGDLRRSLSNGSPHDRVGDHMARSPHIADTTMLASAAVALMNGNSISQLFICRHGELVGIVHLHDLLRAGAT